MDITVRSFVMLQRSSGVVSEKESVLLRSWSLAALASTPLQQWQSRQTLSAASKLAIVVAEMSQKDSQT